MGTSKYMILVPLFDLKSLEEILSRVSQGLQIGGTSVPVLTFASSCGERFCECQNQRDTSKNMILVRFWI